MKRTAGLIAVFILGSAQAGAASRTALNRCSDAVGILGQRGAMIYQAVDVEPLQVDKAKRHLAQVQESFGRAMAQLKQIPKGEFNKSDPELKECWETFSAWGEYKESLQAKIQKASEAGATLTPFLKRVKPQQDAMLRLAAVEVNPAADVLGQATPDQARSMLSGLADVETACATLGPDVGSAPLDDAHKPGGTELRVANVSFHDGFTERANNWCHVAKRRAELMTAAAGNRYVPVEGYGNYVMELPAVLKRLSTERPDVDAWIAEALKDKSGFVKRREALAKAWNAAVGVRPPEGSGLAGQLEALQRKVDEVSANTPAPTTGQHDAALEGKARAALKAELPEATPKATMMQDAGWTVEKNGLGVPLERYRLGYVVFKRPAFKACEQRSFVYRETHQGGGTYAPGAAVIQAQVRFVTCP